MKLERLIYATADALSTPLAFVAICGGFTVAVTLGLALDFGDTYTNVVNALMSLVAILVGMAVLVKQRQAGLAQELKQDRLLEEQGATDAIGAEHEDLEELERKKEAVEAKKSSN